MPPVARALKRQTVDGGRNMSPRTLRWKRFVRATNYAFRAESLDNPNGQCLWTGKPNILLGPRQQFVSLGGATDGHGILGGFYLGEVLEVLWTFLCIEGEIEGTGRDTWGFRAVWRDGGGFFSVFHVGKEAFSY